MNKLMTTLALMITFLCSYGQDVSQVNDFTGNPRFGAISFVINGIAYAGLGEAGSEQYPTDFYRLDTTTGQWIAIAPFPGEGREYGVAFSLDSLGYVGLGFSLSGVNFTNHKDFYQYNPITNQWAQLNDFGGEARVKATAFVVSDKAYVGSGSANGIFLSDFWQYESNSDTWLETSSLALADPLQGMATAVVQEKAYLIGGRNANGIYSENIFEFAPDTNLGWLPIKTIPGLRLESGSAFVHNQKIFFGYGNAKNDLDLYDPKSNTISSYGSIPGLETICTGPIAFSLDSLNSFLGLGYTSVVANQAAAYSNNMWQLNTQIISALDRPEIESEVKFIRSNHNSLTLQSSFTGPWTIRVYGIQGILLSAYQNMYVGDNIPLYFPNGIYILHAFNQSGETHAELFYQQ